MEEIFPLKIPNIPFESDMVTLIMQLETLRVEKIYLDVHPMLFWQLQDIFHKFESLFSARIEGNRTTMEDYVEAKIVNTTSQNIQEINNIDECIKYIDKIFKNNKEARITATIIQDLHVMLTEGLNTEGSKKPGRWRTNNVKIAHSEHVPPHFLKVNDYMEQLVEWINKDARVQEKPLKIAIAHHRFTWIHPFDNGNGRASRLLSYFMLRQYGYRMSDMMNLSGVFCSDRNKYFDYLALADKRDNEGTIAWCGYVLEGLTQEIKKLQKLLNREFFIEKILIPSLALTHENGFITMEQKKVLELSLRVEENLIMLKDLKHILKNKTDRQITSFLGAMLKAELLIRIEKGSRRYLINLFNGSLVKAIVKSLESENLIDRC